ncbi:hypothetical protein BDV30DRAFT_251612 [Aspergillus minisclerotigenes]|uniref:Uncharacterized protein n=1 Tax=Aspergillus minisclerotigenes TaxID=656917 RepID=A0A5N6JF02_9EURO|nr:hypothetical protein BDV30DRAFT_251612 [Aspergillus minisclerotigenes]
MDFIYTLDTDTETFKISQGKRFARPLFPVPTDTYLKPATLREGHDIGIRFTDLGYSHLVPHKHTRVDELDLQRLNLKGLQLEFGIPTAMNELQERIFTDFFFRWDQYLDPSDWGYTNPAWDFEVTSISRTDMGKAVLEQWQYPKTEVFWFHRFLFVIQEDILPVSMKSIAILKARIYLDHNGTNGHVPRLILLSPIHVASVELRKDGVWCSKSLLLVTSSSAAWCSPGFRALSRALSSNYQTPIGDTAAQFEKWRVALPFEILHMILKLCEPRDSVSFAQASVAVEKCYYTSIPQFKGLAVREYVMSIPCCGKPAGLDVRGLCCVECYARQHPACVGLLHWPPDVQYICSKCQKEEPNYHLVLLNSRQYRWRDWPVHIGKSAMSLRYEGDIKQQASFLSLHSSTLALGLPLPDTFITPEIEKRSTMTAFKPLLSPFHVSKEPTNPRGILRLPRNIPSTSVVIRDNFTLSTWLFLGGLLQGLAVIIFGTYALIPTMLILLYRTTDHLLMAANITRNRYMDGVMQTKVSAQAPDANGTFGKEIASESIVVFHLGTRSNHPLGLLAPGFSELNRQVIVMNREMNSDPVKYGLLGTSTWGKQDDPAGNELMAIYYLRDYDALHRFAHGSLHVEGMRWWTKIVKDHPHIAIYHETYLVPKGKWENIYINSKPTGMGDTWFPVVEEEGEEGGVSRFVRPIVDAKHPALRSAARRLVMHQLEGAEKGEDDLYDRTW